MEKVLDCNFLDILAVAVLVAVLVAVAVAVEILDGSPGLGIFPKGGGCRRCFSFFISFEK